MSQPVLKECLPIIRGCPMIGANYGREADYVQPCDPATAPDRSDDDDDIRGLDACRPRPARMAALGDSIADCRFPFVKGDNCAPELIAEYLKAHYAPDLQYQNFAVSGATTTDWPEQAHMVPEGPGHLLVWVYLGGNDIADCAQAFSVDALNQCVDEVIARLTSAWSKLFDYFTDRTRFPDGVTFLLNTQYGLSDECTLPNDFPGGPLRDAKLQAYNREVFIKPAEARDDTIAIDQYPDWLGHGAHADDSRCPHCSREDNSAWLAIDKVHPNTAGQSHIADKWKIALDAMYGHCN
jgi:lysophospholipase L1-like esterase